jgi:hypothetical protein
MTSRAMPTVVKVFGILHCAFGSLGALWGIGNLFQQGATTAQLKQLGVGAISGWTSVTAWLSPLFSLVLLAIGVALLTRQPWARKAAFYFALFGIGFGVLSALITMVLALGIPQSTVRVAFIVGAAFGLLVGLIYPGLTAYFMNQDAVKQAMD